MKMYWLLLIAGLLLQAGLILAQDEDPFLWLEDVTGDKSMEWVKKQNAVTVGKFEAVPGFQATFGKFRDILDSKERIPYPSKRNEYLYNFWRDAEHPRGIYRRTTLDEYRKDNPAWEIILDVDALAKAENENWVFRGMNALYPDYNRALVNLSRGGADATVVREFDIPSKSFVENGFTLPEAKQNVSWVDEDTLFVGTNFGEGSLTQSGYPRIVKLWKRGTPLTEAKTIYEADPSSVMAIGARFFSEDGHMDYVIDGKTFFTRDYFVLQDGELKKLAIPADADIAGYFKKQLLFSLRSDWTIGEQTFKKGSVIIGPADDILAGKLNFKLLIEPGERLSIEGVSTTKNTILVTVLDNVVGKLYQFTPTVDGGWQRQTVPVEDNGSVGVFNTDEKSDDYFLSYQSFLTPDSLYFVPGETGKPEKIKSQTAFFDASPYHVKQYEAESKDGTRIPYFVIMRKDAELNGKNPTMLYGYGGFQVSMTPGYSGSRGLWLEKGGVYVMANIRGGGEFGPQWHQAALKKNRHKAFEDFIAVGEDLIARKITSRDRLAIQGGSNGGLLVGTVMTMRPDLFKAVVCAVPLLDMKRYTKLLAGASWAAEYGDPDDPDMWEYIKTYSPYHNVKKDVEYPAVLFYTSTRDDRVHPGHSRKMTALMQEMGHDKVWYYENIEGGHAGAADNKQRAYMMALGEAFLYDQLFDKK
ncbi:MAG: S9 family peptidase [Acidobacteria bacterium]|nr:S9 family peptidase [Acidobacteriota bacterium]